MTTLRTEKIGDGKFDVYTTGDYPRRAGFIIGGNKRYAAEVGPLTIGYFKSRQKALKAIEAHRAQA